MPPLFPTRTPSPRRERPTAGLAHWLARATLALPALALTVGCATAPGPDPVPITLGLPLPQVMASLEADRAPGTTVRLEEARFLRVDVAPYTPLEREAADDASIRVAALVGRSCRYRDGFSVTKARRASWFLFDGGQLVAIDHDVFEERCEITLQYEPAPKDEAATERDLTRFVAQRYPNDLDDLEGRADRAEAWIRVGRYEEARTVVVILERRIAMLQDRLRRPTEYDDDELLEFQQEHDELRTRRAILVQGLRRAGIFVS